MAVTNTAAFLPQTFRPISAAATAINHPQQSPSSFSSRHPLSASSEDDTEKENKDSSTPKRKAADVKPIILEAFPEAADPMYTVRGPIGQGDFVVSREGGCTKEELTNENIMRIVTSECTDLEVNTLVWKGLGYRFDADAERWTAAECFPNWKEKYPTPPDLIGMTRTYSREVDQISLRSNQALVRSVPVEHKQGLKGQLKPMGWKGYQVCM